MYSIIIAVVVVTMVIILFLALVFINNRQRRKIAGDLVKRFDKLGKENSLVFSKMEILENFIIGLDEACRKIMVLKKSGDTYDSLIINLNEVTGCSKRKIYSRVNIGTAETEIYEKHIDGIALVFDFSVEREPIYLSFYESGSNYLFEMSELEQKAGYWEKMVAKTIYAKQKKIA